MSKLARLMFIILLLFVLIAPLLSTLFLSFSNFSLFEHSELSFTLDWYRKALDNSRFTKAFANSISLSLIVAVFTTFFSFIISLTWWSYKKRIIILFVLLLLGILPPEVLSISFSTLINSCQLYSYAGFFHWLSLLLGILPYTILLIWGLLSLLDTNLIYAARDLGSKELNIVLFIILPLSLPAVVSSFFLSFLLSLNEYSKTFYLSGSNQYLSEYLNGKLTSGADASVYAAGGLNVFLALAFLLAVISMFKARRRY